MKPPLLGTHLRPRANNLTKKTRITKPEEKAWRKGKERKEKGTKHELK